MPSAFQAAVLSLISFIVGALLPLIPWFIGSGTVATILSLAIGVVAAGIVGAVVGKFAERPMAWAATRQVLIVLVACGATYLIGQIFGITLS
jgi:VIT1/CCC1 family predicted Fe2+/Mn2+ transporter